MDKKIEIFVILLLLGKAVGSIAIYHHHQNLIEDMHIAPIS